MGGEMVRLRLLPAFSIFRVWIMRTLLALCFVAELALSTAAARAQGIAVFPANPRLVGNQAQQRLLVTESKDGRTIDRTRDAVYRSDTPDIVRVSPAGLMTAVGTGRGRIAVELDTASTVVEINVEQGDRLPAVTFEKDIEPILARSGCNSGACHGKSRGQNGFQLSLLGFDPQFDYQAIALEARGRRVFPAAPEQSLLLQKPAGLVPHGGGKKIAARDRSYETMLRWIQAGMPRTPAEEPKLERISVMPNERLLTFNEEQQLVVTGHYSDGSARDVTHLTMFQSNESVLAAVDRDGKVKAGPLPGEAAITARFMEKFAICNILIPQPKAIAADLYDKLPRKNFIDELAWAKLRKLNIVPSAAAKDTTFLRRAYLDVIGRLPTPEEAKAFLADTRSDKRDRLIDDLLERPEYADFWANKWADLLRPNPYRVGIKAVLSLDTFLRDSFRQNKPHDQFVREIVTAQGSTWRNGATVVFRDRREPDEVATLVSQLFLGVRMECAKCHHHPFEIWSQDDFYSLAAFFARVGRKGQGVSPPISGGEEVISGAGKGQVRHPVTGQALAPRPLLGKAVALDEESDPRRALADWMLADDNPYFAKVAVNRVWADVFGRGIVEPIDDLRATNPPSNGPLLDALAEHFRKEKYDYKKLLRTILTSQVYGLGSEPNPDNVADLRNYSRHYRQRLRAEVLLDAVGDVTGVRDKFTAAPVGTRSMALWTVRTESFFLDAFSRPDPNQDPPCERTGETSVVQALHLMNSPALNQKIVSESGRAGELANSKRTPDEIIGEIYLLTFARLPHDREREICRKLFADTPRRRAVEDLMWTLINTPEFVMKD
jgi:hypothetical protein